MNFRFILLILLPLIIFNIISCKEPSRYSYNKDKRLFSCMHKNKTICVEFYSNKFTSNDEISSTKDSQNYLCDGDLVNFCDGNNLKIVVENIQKTKRTKKIENTTHCSDFDRIDYYYNTYKNDIKTIKNYYTANSNNEKIIFHIINENN